MLKGWLKRWLPPKAQVYAWRLLQWLLIARSMRGANPLEEAKLLLSALAAPVTALRGLGTWRAPVLLFDTTVMVSGTGRFRCERRTDDLWHVLPAAEAAVRRALGERLKPGGTFVDAGANIGGLTIYGARLVGPEGHVVAVEMMPETARRLREHLDANGLGWVRVVEKALSDATEQNVEARMPVGQFGLSSIAPSDRIMGETVVVQVPTTTLDAVVQDLSRIDVMKVDLEGAEAMAFEGARDALARTRCVIFEDKDGPGADQGVAARIADAGFELARLDACNMIGVR